MSKPTITEEAFTAAIEKAVADKGADYVYEREGRGCVYSSAGEPSCIVGTALANLGFEMNPEWDNPLYENDNGSTGAETILPLHFDIPENVIVAATIAQSNQDFGGTWGDALAAYKQAVSA